jgi:hypothetical protein
MPKLWWYGYGQNLHRQMNSFIDVLFGANWSKKIRGIPGLFGLLQRGNRI